MKKYLVRFLFALCSAHIVQTMELEQYNQEIPALHAIKTMDKQIRHIYQKLINVLIEASGRDDGTLVIGNILSELKSANVQNSDNRTPLYEACEKGCLNNVNLLLEFGADPNRGIPYETPLMVAVKNGHLAVVQRLLLEKSIEVDAQHMYLTYLPKSDYTALMHAVSDNYSLRMACKQTPQLRRNLIMALLSAHANRYLKNKNNETASDIAAKNGFDDLVELINTITFF